LTETAKSLQSRYGGFRERARNIVTFQSDRRRCIEPNSPRGPLGNSRLQGRFMLVLSRRKDESIVINHDIRIVVVEIRGDKVRLGVEAPKEVPVHRREVFEAIAGGEPVEADETVPAEHRQNQGESPPVAEKSSQASGTASAGNGFPASQAPKPR